MWTGGCTEVAGSSNMAAWQWNMTTHLQPLTYIKWASDQPNNRGGNQHTITFAFDGSYYYGDMPYEQFTGYDHCYICKCEHYN